MGLQGTLPGTQKVLCGRQLAIKARCSRSSRTLCRQQTVMEATTKDKAKNQKLYREAVDVAEESDNTNCEVFVEPDGQVTQAMCCDYGFRSGVGRLYQGRSGEIPKNFFALGAENFAREFKQLRRSFRFNEYKSISEVNPPNNPLEKAGGAVASKFVGALATIDEKLEESSILAKLDPNPEPEPARQGDGELTSDCSDVRTVLKGLKLSNKKVAIRERAREDKEGKVEAPWPIKFAYDALCWSLDIMYNNRPVQRFWVLEVVARMPYFAYISMLHLYESLGWWRAGAELRKVHFAEEWNELHHLQIMESLGGDQLWWDRFLAQHAAVFYYWVLILFYTLAPRMAYVFSELVEHHATDTYAEFVVENEDLLKSLPPPVVALEYYRGGDLYYFDNFQTSDRSGDPRRPSCRNLYEVFCNVRDDEQEHVKTMHACADYSIVEQIAKMKGRLSPVQPVNGNGKPKNMDEQQMDASGSHL